jgi:hypothetical protein
MVCVMLGASSYYFNKDATNLVLTPIERMLERIKIIAKDPMTLCSDEQGTDGVLAVTSKKRS